MGLVTLLLDGKDLSRLRTYKGAKELLITGAAGAYKSGLIAGIAAQETDRPVLVLTYSLEEAQRLVDDLVSLLPGVDIALFRPQEVYPYEEVVQDFDILGERLRALALLSSGGPGIVVAPITAAVERLFPREVFRKSVQTIGRDSLVDLKELEHFLSQTGYERVDVVQGRGQFSIRGGIVDLFPVTSEIPVRIELFDIEVDSIRSFELQSQRSVENLSKVEIVPAREALTPEVLGEAVGKIRAEADEQVKVLERLGAYEAARRLTERIDGHVEKLENGIYFAGVEQYKVHLYPQLETILDYVEEGVVVFDEPVRVREYELGLAKDVGESITHLLETGRLLPSAKGLYATWHDILKQAQEHRVIYLSALGKRVSGMAPEVEITASGKQLGSFHGQQEMLLKAIAAWRNSRYRILFSLSTQERAKRMQELLREEGVTALYTKNLDGRLKEGNVILIDTPLSSGFELADDNLVVLTDTELYGKRKYRRRVKTDEETVRITDYTDLRQGDYVVHINHGIGQYLGVETLEVAGVHKDYLVVRYAGEDKLYVPTEQVGMLQKYIGVEGQPPKVYKLGGNEWARVKSRVKESVQDMAKGLLKLYAEREHVKGYAFSPDTVWQEEFEDSFPYEETPDQFKAIEDVKRDMESDRPMDRLLCGDVGYGKTEVAIRAAFKCVMDGKQVAVLVPTTILAQQHHRTFTERFEGYPITIEALSRFQTAAEQKDILDRLARGQVDIVIGTHRMLSKDVTFRDLGLVIVDEEQRFGVAQKERLKEIRTTVDVLTLTATPIPRTLQMSLVGVRDMSIIETPPENRFPIRTYVVEYDEDLIAEAIRRELARDGQVYFVYNRVQTIDAMYLSLQRLVPEARLAVAHGQMDEGRLEQIMIAFLQGEYDILLCTTIIETGMDISNVNTLIIYDADRMGLAQLYQLRGRVGRTNRVAYAYFTCRRDKILTEDAEKRLQAIKEFTELGSGFKIAMRDLEIRGAGNLLGPEQHGFIASVGFDLYCRLLDESVRELRGQRVQELPEPSIDLDVDAYLPDEYIGDARFKVEIYKKIAAIRSEEDALDLQDQILDRFGTVPQPVLNLLSVARIRTLGKRIGLGSVSRERFYIVLRMLAGVSLPASEIQARFSRYRGKVVILPARVTQVKIRVGDMNGPEVLSLVEQVIKDILATLDHKLAIG